MDGYDINAVFQKYRSLGKKQRAEVIAALRGRGIMLTRIEPYTYSEAKGIRHLFFYFEGSTEAVPYFLLEPSVWQCVQTVVMGME